MCEHRHGQRLKRHSSVSPHASSMLTRLFNRPLHVTLTISSRAAALATACKVNIKILGATYDLRQNKALGTFNLIGLV